MKRIIWHWTAGAYGDIAIEREHYHFLIVGDRIVPGKRNPEANRSTRDGDYSAHTRALNTGSIGVAIDAMAGARQSPWSPGSYPIKREQVDALVRLSADLSETYGIPVERETMLSHAEVPRTLGVPQRGKWDITWLPGMDQPGHPVNVGDELRRRVREELMNRQAPPPRRGFWSRFLASFRKLRKGI